MVPAKGCPLSSYYECKMAACTTADCRQRHHRPSGRLQSVAPIRRSTGGSPRNCCTAPQRGRLGELAARRGPDDPSVCSRGCPQHLEPATSTCVDGCEDMGCGQNSDTSSDCLLKGLRLVRAAASSSGSELSATSTGIIDDVYRQTIEEALNLQEAQNSSMKMHRRSWGPAHVCSRHKGLSYSKGSNRSCSGYHCHGRSRHKTSILLQPEGSMELPQGQLLPLQPMEEVPQQLLFALPASSREPSAQLQPFEAAIDPRYQAGTPSPLQRHLTWAIDPFAVIRQQLLWRQQLHAQQPLQSLPSQSTPSVHPWGWTQSASSPAASTSRHGLQRESSLEAMHRARKQR